YVEHSPASNWPPIDAERGQTEEMSITAQRIQKRISRRVMCLARRSPNRCNRRKADKEVQGQMFRELMQNPSALQFGTQHLVPAGCGHLCQSFVTDDARGVHDTTQGRMFRLNRLQQLLNILLASDIRTQYVHVAAGGAGMVCRPSRLRIVPRMTSAQYE